MKRWMVWVGIFFSLGILTIALLRMDWQIFLAAFTNIEIAWLTAAAIFSLAGLAVRSLRWNIVSGRPLQQYFHFWRVAAIGQFCNFIYPLRAGDILRIMLLSKFAKVPLGQAAMSAVVDRVNDGFLLILLLLFVLSQHGSEVIGVEAVVIIIISFGLMVLGTVVFVIWGLRASSLIGRLSYLFSPNFAAKIDSSYEKMLEVSGAFRRPRRLFGMVVVNIFVLTCDIGMAAMLISTMGWDLPLSAALAIVVFLWAGSALPSTPGFIGIYQIACVLALKLYSVDESSALAYSVVLHLLSLAAAAIQGSIAAGTYGISLRHEYSQNMALDSKSKQSSK